MTTVLVFLRRLPSWLTGGSDPERRVRRVRRAAGFAVWLLLTAVLAAALVEHPPHGRDLGHAGFFFALYLGGSIVGLIRVLPKRPIVPRASARRRQWAATSAAWAVGVLAVAAEVVSIVVTGGWLPWVIPVPGLVAVLTLVAWRSDLAETARCLASGEWTRVPAASLDVRPGEPVDGWAVLPDDQRVRFHLPAVPADVAVELAERRRMWVAGWPSHELVVGVPDGETYVVGLIGVHRDRKNTVSAGAGRR